MVSVMSLFSEIERELVGLQSSRLDKASATMFS